MLISRTSAVQVSIQATSPLLGVGAGAAAGAAAAGTAGADVVDDWAPACAGAAAAGAAGAAGAALSCANVAPANARAAVSAIKLNARFILSFPLIKVRRRRSRRCG